MAILRKLVNAYSHPCESRQDSEICRRAFGGDGNSCLPLSPTLFSRKGCLFPQLANLLRAKTGVKVTRCFFAKHVAILMQASAGRVKLFGSGRLCRATRPVRVSQSQSSASPGRRLKPRSRATMLKGAMGWVTSPPFQRRPRIGGTSRPDDAQVDHSRPRRASLIRSRRAADAAPTTAIGNRASNVGA
jgi:hypothetical protein